MAPVQRPAGWPWSWRHATAVGVATVLLVPLAACTRDDALTGQPVGTGSGAVATTGAAPSAPASAEPETSSPQTSAANPPATTRPTVGATRPATNKSAVVTASATGTTGDGVPIGGARFGQPFQFPSGLKVNVTAPVRFTPSSSADAPPGVRHVQVTVTLQNSSSAPIDLGTVGHDATSGGVDAVRFFDPGAGIPAPATERDLLAPGAVRTYRVAFAQQNTSPLVVRTMYAWDGAALHR
ncbi:hypothetical protein ACQCX5_07275 [Propionibacteriaceae bacterium G57]|uniref:hypothetical protein n=1 Tax=Aestuariimicrobium sp. G57 TaxID=3418485 RepID=UPI003DA6F6EF